MIRARCDYGHCPAPAVVMVGAGAGTDPAGRLRELRPACRPHSVEIARGVHRAGLAPWCVDVRRCAVLAVAIAPAGDLTVTLAAHVVRPGPAVLSYPVSAGEDAPEYVREWLEARKLEPVPA